MVLVLIERLDTNKSEWGVDTSRLSFPGMWPVWPVARLPAGADSQDWRRKRLPSPGVGSHCQDTGCSTILVLQLWTATGSHLQWKQLQPRICNTPAVTALIVRALQQIQGVPQHKELEQIQLGTGQPTIPISIHKTKWDQDCRWRPSSCSQIQGVPQY